MFVQTLLRQFQHMCDPEWRWTPQSSGAKAMRKPLESADHGGLSNLHCTCACRARQQLLSHIHAARDACRRTAEMTAAATDLRLAKLTAAEKPTGAAAAALESPQQLDGGTAGQGAMHEDEVVAAAAAVVAHAAACETAGQAFCWACRCQMLRVCP